MKTDLEHSGLLRKSVETAVGVEAAHARAHHRAGAESGEPPQDVNHARAGDVEHTAAKQQVPLTSASGGCPAAPPQPVRHDGVDERGQDNGIHNVRIEAHALGHRAGDDGGGLDGDGPPKYPYGVVVAVGESAVLALERGTLEGEVGLGPDEAACYFLLVLRCEQGRNDATAATGTTTLRTCFANNCFWCYGITRYFR